MMMVVLQNGLSDNEIFYEDYKSGCPLSRSEAPVCHSCPNYVSFKHHVSRASSNVVL